MGTCCGVWNLSVRSASGRDSIAQSKLRIGLGAELYDALLIIWSDDLDAEYLEPLLDTAHKHRAER